MTAVLGVPVHPSAQHHGSGAQGGLSPASASGPHLYVTTVVTTCGQLDAPEGDGALEGHLNGRLLHTILTVGSRGAGDGATAKVPLDCGEWEGETESGLPDE